MTQLILAVDIGNTNMEFGVCEKDAIKCSFRLTTNHNITSDEVGLFLMQFFTINEITKEDIDDVIISSVVPQMMYSITNAIKKYIDKQPLIIGDNLPINIENLYANPQEVGADRLVNALAAHHKYGGPLIVVDFGTATTFDAVNAKGAYLGGAIYPGIKISMDALFQHTAKLPRVELKSPGGVIGTTTVTSMQAGAVYGYVGAVLHIVQHMQKELGGKAKVIATGGLAQVIAAEEHTLFDAIDRPLTLMGLLKIYNDYKA